MTPSLAKTIDFQRERALLFAPAPAKIYLGHFATVSVLIYLAQDVLAWPWLLLWGLVEICLTPLALYYLRRQAALETTNIVRWQHQLKGLFAFVGTSWGLFLFFSFNTENAAYFAIQMSIVAGAAAASTQSLGIFKNSFLYYELPFLGLVTLRISSLGGDFYLLAGLVLIFMVMMHGLAKDTYNALTNYLEAKSENLDLAAKYATAAKDAEQANAAKTRFLAQANHDLRQPIHAIGLLTESLRSQPMSKVAQETLDTIDMSVESLAKLFKSLLNISALDSRGIRPEVAEYDVSDILSQVLRQAQPEAQENNCQLVMVPSSLRIKTDHALLSSILQNLVFNAVKYAPGSRILVGVRRCGGSVSIHVLDQGPGVPSELQEKVFTEFFRGNPHGPGRVEGLGLGLSIVRRTADLLNLRVTFDSVEGLGTHVAVRGLPRVAGTSFGKEPARLQSQLKDPTGLRVLVVDDNHLVLKGLETLLSGWGYQVDTRFPNAELPSDADLVLMDYHLNQKADGLEMAKALQERWQRRVPFALISGTVTQDIERLAKDAGMWVLQKPVVPLQLRSLLLAMAKTARELER
jgi:signal transduction histidine kinase